MPDITPLASPVTRSQFFAFQEAHPLPSGTRPHLYSRMFHPPAGDAGREIAVDVLLTGIMRPSGPPSIGIRGYVDDLGAGPDLRYRLDCEPEDGDVRELEDWMVGVFDGLAEALSSAGDDARPDAIDDIFHEWGVGIEGASW